MVCPSLGIEKLEQAGIIVAPHQGTFRQCLLQRIAVDQMLADQSAIQQDLTNGLAMDLHDLRCKTIWAALETPMQH
jgi:hypothetical protein